MDVTCVVLPNGVMNCSGEVFFGAMWFVLEFFAIFIFWILIDMYRWSNYKKILVETGHEDALLDIYKAQRKYVKTEIVE